MFMYLILCRSYYFIKIIKFCVDPTISLKDKIRKTISILTLTQKYTVLIEKRVKLFLLYEHVQIFWYGSTLTSKCKTGVPERTLQRTRFVKAWLCMCHVWWEQFIDAAGTLKLRVINPSYLKKLHGC